MRGCIPKLLLERAILKVVRNTVEDVKFNIATIMCSVMLRYGITNSPTDKRFKARLRQLKLREEEHDRIIRLIEGIRK
jgi:hypothetical protein